VILIKNKKNIYILLEIFLLTSVIFLFDINPFGFFDVILFNATVNKGSLFQFYIDPYLFIIIYASTRYGTLYGLLNSTLTILYMFISIITNNVDIYLVNDTNSFILLHVAVYLGSSFVFGILKDIDNIKNANLQNRTLFLEEVIDDLKNTLRKHEDAIDDLKEKLSLENKGVSLLVEKLRDIQISKIEDVYNNGIELISNFIGADTVSIYNLEKNGFLRLKVRKGEGLMPNSLVPEDSIVMKYALKNGVANINVLLLTDETGKIMNEPAIAASIKSKNEVLGFIIVELISPNKLNKNTETYLNVISDWFATMLNSSEIVNKELEVLTKNEDGSYKFEYYNRYFDDYLERYKRFKMPFSTLGLKVVPERKNDFINLMRKMDIVFSKPEEDQLFFIFGICDTEGLSKVISRMNTNFGGDFEILSEKSYDIN